MTILITGATGRIGRHLVTQLLDDGHHVRAITRNPATAQLPEAAEVVRGDLTDLDSLRDAFAGIEALHLMHQPNPHTGDDHGDHHQLTA